MKLRKYIVYASGCALFAFALFAGIEPSQPTTLHIELTQEQLSIVQQCMNAAVKVGGLSDARIIIPVWDSIESQVKSQINN